ncbi:hypothetical protein [Microbulbifer sp. 2205BS26-8]|uniref:hypothetical protein n=1 Tax=Microbulbifer sp. 2205BS26-8 TaxID=3064386 RepID=UPI00273DD761|nr:hypothetical protein [Microbulbifer sp. 2205BS26-8]MDP5211213.1 hypothetical protein [Microbulbifer sp. 2205BS26-8]
MIPLSLCTCSVIDYFWLSTPTIEPRSLTCWIATAFDTDATAQARRFFGNNQPAAGGGTSLCHIYPALLVSPGIAGTGGKKTRHPRQAAYSPGTLVSKKPVLLRAWEREILPKERRKSNGIGGIEPADFSRFYVFTDARKD